METSGSRAGIPAVAAPVAGSAAAHQVYPVGARRTLRSVGASYKAEAVVLRSIRLGEADRVLHLYTRERGRVGAVAKGIRRTKSRFGARLEPLTQVALVLHEGRGELHTVSGAEIVESHHAV